jgi:hypothetical protein
MTDFAPCPACQRHVEIREIACPFCASQLPRLRPQWSLPSRLTRAAIFSAALAACSDDKPRPPAPQPGSGASGSDLEKLLDGDHRTVDRPAPAIDAALPDATAIAAAVDAGVPPDAGIDPKVLAEAKRRREAERRRKEQERLRQQQEQELELQRLKEDVRHHAKPYGAPPARRRVV